MNLLHRATPVASLLIGLTLVSTQAAAAAPAHQATHTGSLKPLVLSVGNVNRIFGAGFSVLAGASVPNNRVRGGLSIGGRKSGYTVEFTGPTKSSVFSVLSSVDQFGTTKGAQQNFQARVTAYKSHRTHGIVGDEALVASVGRGGNFTASVVFRRGKYIATIGVVTTGKKPKMSTVIKAASADDHRIQQHG
jgi:hypothetical protein